MRYQEVPTYTLTDDTATHTGYFIITDGMPLKWTMRGPWDDLKQSATFEMNIPWYINRMQPA